MNRRQLLSISALSIPLTGCVKWDFDGATENNSPAQKMTETPSKTATETGTTPSEVSTPECWPSMCEGSQLVEAQVVGGFSGAVVLIATCRDKELSIQAGEPVRINRDTDAQTCRIVLSVDGKQEFSETVNSHQSVNLTVGSDGEMTERWIVQ
ncbi:hypothetical protein RBH20_02805 [Haloarcula sp. H-GB4]|uniref:hypothetical protein n=1 Tax=Haloarcula sp. H-GB4 TaxID=3069755 RepID=UPI0027B5265A|nr:hypothetical protein [Haloarcula sp. H-GB4]MDQ2071463.1 hypothetical protein [Haloarcula sp. H-GB4]